jgi:hypothetical protein
LVVDPGEALVGGPVGKAILAAIGSTAGAE